ncbi:MAG: alanine--tRNA ligase, partial [Armatimonadetes bacterium]|nr:alanine--tRNA ligase [Anaerolineae bacterium]
QNDDEAYNIWVNDLGIDPVRVARMGPKTNFWQMAETGPCGSTSEIHWDKTPEQGESSIVAQLQEEDDRFLEIWNLVFMQFNRTQADPTHSGQYDEPLPAPGVDTGMGLERIVSIVQGVKANYETDLFMPIIQATQALTGQSDAERDANIIPYRVIADHVRAAVFLIADGVRPGAKGRDSVCRLVIRRAARFGSKLGFNTPFLAQVSNAVFEVMGGHYTDLLERAEAIKQVITKEEVAFRRTLDRGVSELNALLDALPAGGQLPGEQAFYLKATLGLPFEVVKDICEERGCTLDEAGYLQAETTHSLVSGGGQAMGVIASAEQYADILANLKAEGKLAEAGVEYTPYGDLSLVSHIMAIISDGALVENAIVGDAVEVVLRHTPFYVESGGQVSDSGYISGDGWTIQIETMRKPVSGLIVHSGEVVEGTPHVNDPARAEVDGERRADIIRNHTATHLLHAALRNQLGTHVQQRGSLVAPERLRFDFAHDTAVSATELQQVEYEVNAQILENYRVNAVEKSLADARADGAMALFGEKYGDRVRTITIGDGNPRYSYELCGGVHVGSTGQIGTFIIVNEGSVSAGVRRLEALTGHEAVKYMQHSMNTLYGISEKLNTQPDKITERLGVLQDDLAAAKRQ